MSAEKPVGEDWELLKTFLPSNWRFLARRTDAIKGLRQDKSEENCLRTLLIHLACGYSLRETVVRAREAHLAELSDVALLKRLRKSEEWLYELCRSLRKQTWRLISQPRAAESDWWMPPMSKNPARPAACGAFTTV